MCNFVRLSSIEVKMLWFKLFWCCGLKSCFFQVAVVAMVSHSSLSPPGVVVDRATEPFPFKHFYLLYHLEVFVSLPIVSSDQLYILKSSFPVIFYCICVVGAQPNGILSHVSTVSFSLLTSNDFYFSKKSVFVSNCAGTESEWSHFHCSTVSLNVIGVNGYVVSFVVVYISSVW